MKLPQMPTGTRYLPSTMFNSQVTFIDPNAGQAVDGTPNPPVTVATTWANVSPWRSKEVDKQQTRTGQSTYKIVIHYPKTYSINSGMQIQVGTQLHNIDSLYDPDTQRVEIHIYTFVDNDVLGGQ